MYEGETISQIFKRTKKCCAKILRKISFSPQNSTNIPVRIRGHSSRYTPKEDKIRSSSSNSSQHSDLNDDWSSNTSSRQPEKNISAQTFFDDIELDDDDDECHQMFHLPPRLFPGQQNTPRYIRVKNSSSSSKNQQQQHSSSIPKISSLNLTDLIFNGKQISRPNTTCGHYDKFSSHHQNEDTFSTDNKIYFDLTEMNGKSSSTDDDDNVNNNNNNTRNNKTKNKKERNSCEQSLNGGGCKSRNDFFGLKFQKQQQHNTNTNVNDCDFHNKKTTRTCNKHENKNCIISQNFIEKFDSCLNLAAQNFQNTINPSRIRCLSTNNNFYRNGKDNTRTSLSCSRLNFNILKEENIVNTCSTCWNSEMETFSAYEKVLFEKVKYDKNKRYLRHTPSISSADSTQSSPKSNHFDEIMNNINWNTNYTDLNGNPMDDDDDEVLQHQKNTSIVPSCEKNNDNNGNRKSQSFNSLRRQKNCFGNSKKEDDVKEIGNICGAYSHPHHHHHHHHHQYLHHSNDLNRQNFVVDPWDVFDGKIKTIRDRKFLALHHDEFIFRSGNSPKSSSTTLETWVDDEIFDNTFNEELERHYIPIER